MRTKRTLAVDWTDIYIENVPIVSASVLNGSAVKGLVRAVRHSRTAGRLRPRIQVLAHIV